MIPVINKLGSAILKSHHKLIRKLFLSHVIETFVSFLKRADIAAAAITVTERREKVVDFTVPYMYYTNELLIKETFSAGAISLFQFMLPFHRHVWISTLASQVAIAIAVFVINYFSPYGYKDENGKGTSEEFSFFNSVWFSLACMLQQGGDNTPKSLSGTGK